MAEPPPAIPPLPLKPHRGVFVLVLGVFALGITAFDVLLLLVALLWFDFPFILSWTLYLPPFREIISVPFGIAAWVLASSDLKKIASGVMDPSGRNMARIGKVFGIIAVVLNSLYFLSCILGVLWWLLRFAITD